MNKREREAAKRSVPKSKHTSLQALAPKKAGKQFLHKTTGGYLSFTRVGIPMVL